MPEVFNVKIQKCDTEKAMNDFIAFPRKLYKGDGKYVHDIDVDVRNFFDPKKNRALVDADVQPFVAYCNGQCVGRVAALISNKSNEKWGKKNVRFTYLDFIDDLNVSRALLDAVADYGREHGMDTVEGPMGIADFDKEGMLVEDFDQQGNIMEFWIYPYYVEHMEELGFEKSVDWLQFQFDVPEVVPARYARVAQYAREEFHLKVRKISKYQALHGYGLKIFHLFNEAFAPLYGTSLYTDEQAMDYLKSYVPMLDMDIVPMVENEKGELVACAVTIADPSDGVRKAQGRLFPFGWWHILKSLTWGKSNKAQLMMIAVRPDMQGLGVNALIFDDLIPIYHKKGITWCETNPQLEDNMKELSQWKPLNPRTVKRRRCWIRKI